MFCITEEEDWWCSRELLTCFTPTEDELVPTSLWVLITQVLEHLKSSKFNVNSCHGYIFDLEEELNPKMIRNMRNSPFSSRSSLSPHCRECYVQTILIFQISENVQCTVCVYEKDRLVLCRYEQFHRDVGPIKVNSRFFTSLSWQKIQSQLNQEG